MLKHEAIVKLVKAASAALALLNQARRTWICFRAVNHKMMRNATEARAL